MVVSRSDSKRRKKEEVDSLQESPKRTKVHAQRKFAQGSHLNSPVLTPVKDKDKTKYNGAAPAAELLPIKRPKTEQFVNFLCFRGSDLLPKSLEFFNEPSIPEPLAGEEDVKRDGASTSGGPSRSGRSSDRHDQAGGVAKAEARNKSKSKSMAAVQALKKKYQEQRMNKEKRTLTKLALKVKGKNMMRTRSAGPLEEKPATSATHQKKSVRTARPVPPVKTKAGPAPRKPVLRKHSTVVKRLPSKSVTRGGLRSAGGLPPGSDEGLKTERKPRKFIKMKPAPLKKSVKKAVVASSLSDFSSDDDQPLVKKQRVMSKATILASRVTTRSRLMSKTSTSNTSSRPPRKTKEAATLFMEMLKKDLRNPDDEEDNVDSMFVDSFDDVPKRTERRGSKDSTETTTTEKKSVSKPVRKETKPNDNKLLVRNNRKLPDKPASRLSCLKTRTLRRNSYRLVAKEIELKRLKNSRAKLMTRMASRSSSKETSQGNSGVVEKTMSKGLATVRDNRRDRRSNSNPSKTPETKSKQQKSVTKESEPSSSKVSKKKSPEATFDDSDEEPLGKKVNQNHSSNTSKVTKKSKPTSEKEESSFASKEDVLEPKLTRRRSLNTTQDVLKEEMKQTTQSVAKGHQASKNTVSNVEGENSGKVKTEPITKPKSSDTKPEIPNPKTKQVGVGSNEASPNITKKPKDTEKSSIPNKTQTEKKGKKSVPKSTESEDIDKSQDDSLIVEKKHQAGKNVKTPDCKKTSETTVNEANSSNTSKYLSKVSEPKSSSENVTKKESALKCSKESLDKCNNLGKSISKKSAPTSNKGSTNVKIEPVLSASSSKNIISDTVNPASEKLSEPKKVSVRSSDQTTLPKEFSLESKSNDKYVIDTKLGFENLSDHVTMQTKADKIITEKAVCKASRPVGNTMKEESNTKDKTVLSKGGNSQVSEVEPNDKDVKEKEFEEKSKSSLALKTSLQAVSPKNPTLFDISSDGSVLPENISLNDKKVEVAVDNFSLPVPQDEQLKISSLNNFHKQLTPSLLKVKSGEGEKAKDKDLNMIPKATDLVDSTSKSISNKVTLLVTPIADNFSKLPDKSVSDLKGVTLDNCTKLNILPNDSFNKTTVANLTLSSKSQVVDPKLIAVTKSLTVENEQNPVPKMGFSGAAASFTNISTSKCISEKKTSGSKDTPGEVQNLQLVQPTKLQPTNQQFLVNIGTGSGEKLKIRNVVLEPTLSKNLVMDVKCLPVNPIIASSDFKGKIPEKAGIKETTIQTKVKSDSTKSVKKEENFIDNTTTLGNLDMSDKISSAVETLMSLKNVQKIDEKSFAIQSGVWQNVKSGQSFDIDYKRLHETEIRRSNENEQKHLDTIHESKKVKIKEGEVKRVTIQEPEFKRFPAQETDSKRPNPLESDFRRYMPEQKPKPEHPQVLKGCSNPKSMLKPGTLIDIAGISHSPEIMTPLRPGVDGEIIPMNRPIRPLGQECADAFKATGQGFQPYQPRVEPSAFGYRWQGQSPEKNSKSEHLSEKEVADSKSKTSVNESAWRLAFKNVKDPKSSNNVPTEKPAAKKQLSVTALMAKRYKSKTEIVSDKSTQPQSSTSVPFLRQSKAFLGPSPTKGKDAVSSGAGVSKGNVGVDPASLREKEAEVEEFLRQCVSLAPSATHVNPSTPVKAVEDASKSGSIKAPYLPSHCDSSNKEEQISGNLYHTSDSSYAPKTVPSHHDQLEISPFANDGIKRAGSPHKFEKRQTQSGSNSTELSLNKHNLAATNSQDNLNKNNPISSVSYLNQDQSVNIFQIDSIRRSNSPKSLSQKNPLPDTDIKSKFDDSSFCSSSSIAATVGEPNIFLVGTQQTSLLAKQPLPDKVHHFSPNRSSQSVVPDNLFRDSNLIKRTKSPTLMDSYSQQNSSPKGNSISRNTNSPVFGKCSTNIFKEIVPAKRSYSPTLLSTSPSDSDTLPNVFSQNQKFRRSVSPLSNRSGFSKSGTTNDNNTESSKTPKVLEEKKDEISLDNSLRNLNSTLSSANISVTYGVEPVEQQTKNPALNVIPQPCQMPQTNKAVTNESLVVKEEVTELDETKGSYLASRENTKQDIKPLIERGSEKPAMSSNDKDGQVEPGMSQAKHRLPLPVEQTLKKLGQARSPQNKKPPQKLTVCEQNVKNIQSQNEEVLGQDDTTKCTQNVVTPKLSTGIYSHNQEGELDLMQKKKVNMSAEEIKRWLDDSLTSHVEHRANCGILENNTCECEYRSTLAPSLQNIDTLKLEALPKGENITLSKPVQNKFDTVATTKKTTTQIKLPAPEVFEVEDSCGLKGKEEKDAVKEIKKEELGSSESTFLSKKEAQKNVVLPNKTSASNQLKEEGLIPITNFCTPVSVGNSTSVKQSSTTSPVSKLRTFRLPNKNVETEQKPTPSSDTVDITTPARDDGSSSNDLSSSNEETPEKAHERKSIFHQRRSTLKVKERRELLAPSVNAFSPENESSVYAFDPELPPTSTPFRRSKGKDGKPASTTTDDEELTPSSNSIAVQVNFDNEAVLECSTQTDVQEGDDDDTHTFYIPLQQSAADTSKPPLIQGVAVKVDTEGPDQKVIMRAKLVTKPLSSFNQSTSSPRGLIGTRSGKPEQKVRPLSVKPPVGTVQPTARPKPKPPAQDDQPGPSKAKTEPTCSPQAARLAKRIKSKAAVPSTSAESQPAPAKVAPAKLVEAPTFYPTEKEFEDPLEYISSITPKAERFGLCRVVPPSNFKPECKVSDDMRFTAYNQYIHKMLHRWGPNVKEMLAIKKYLATQSIALTHPPWIGGMEVDLPRLYQTVQQCGGLKEVIEKKRWTRVADAMKIPKSAQDRVTKLDDIYCKFLLPYDTLSHAERTQLFERVEQDWIEREKRVANQQDDDDEDSDSDSDSDIDECIVKGRSMALNGFYRIARNTMSMWFPKTDTPSAADVELEFWKHVASRQHHVCVHSGSIDSGAMGYGFPTAKNSSTSRHPWNLKMLTNNPGSVLRFLGPLMGVTVPTLHVGMLFSACCWYRDPHGLPWIEYLHTGASKIWYGIPDSSSSQFRDAVMSIVPRLCRDKTLWLASDTAMVPPPLLVERGVSLSRIVQEPGQFIVVFPKAFTSSVCTGYLVSESVYFAQPSWLATAQALFNDMRESSEPTVFSLEKLLFSIVNDSRASVEVLNQILGIVVSLRDGEVAGRRQLEELGLNSSERQGSKRRGKRAAPQSDTDEELECDECRMTLYISWMTNSQDGSVYCLPHAVELLSNKRSLVKHCTLVYAFSEEELEELVEKLKSRVENKNQKKSVAKSSKS